MGHQAMSPRERAKQAQNERTKSEIRTIQAVPVSGRQASNDRGPHHKQVSQGRPPQYETPQYQGY